jgi:hypothetical protein
MSAFDLLTWKDWAALSITVALLLALVNSIHWRDEDEDGKD